MSENKMTPTPWVAGGTFPYKGNEGYIFSTSSRPEVLVCKTFGSIDENCPPLDQQLANSSAIVLAVNGTYGKGINPEGVEELLNYVKAITAALDRYFLSVSYETSDSKRARKEIKEIHSLAKTVINKAKI